MACLERAPLLSSLALPDPVTAPRLTRRFQAVFASGIMAEAIVSSVTGQFTLIYYNQVRGLDPVAVGAVLAAGIIAMRCSSR